MRSDCIATVSRSNFDSAIEAFLRSTDTIHDSETPVKMDYRFPDKDAVIVVTNFE